MVLIEKSVKLGFLGK